MYVHGLWKAFLHVTQGTKFLPWSLFIQIENKEEREWDITWEGVLGVDSLERTLMLGGIGGRRRSGWQRMRWLDGTTDSVDLSLGRLLVWWWTGRPGMLPRFTKSQTRLSDWMEWNEIFLRLSNLLVKILVVKTNWYRFKSQLHHCYSYNMSISRCFTVPSLELWLFSWN